MTDISLSVGEIRRAVRLLAHCYCRRNTIPVLGYSLVSAKDGEITITQTDLDMEVSVSLEGSVSKSGKFLAPFPALRAACEGMAEGDLLRISADGEFVSIEMSGMQTRLRSLSDVTDFPTWGSWKLEAAGTLGEPDVHRYFGLLRHCMSDEVTRYYLNGAFVTQHPETGRMRTVATDGHRLAVIDGGVLWAKDGRIFPAELVNLLLATTDRAGNRDVTFEVGDVKLEARVGDVTIRSKLIDGTFPDYTRVLPTHDMPNRVNLTGAALSRAQRFVKLAMNGRYGATELDADEARGAIRMFDNNSVSFPIEVAARGGSGGRIGFNSKHLADQGRITPTFQVAFGDPGAPGEIRSEDPDALWVLMPMRI